MGYDSFAQVVDDLRNLNKDIEVVRQELVVEREVSYESQDARQVALDGLQCDIGACGNWINALTSLRALSQEKYGYFWEQEYLKSIGTALHSGNAEDLMLDYLRNTLATKAHFKIDSLFSNLLRAHSASPEKPGFWHLSKDMLILAGICPKGPENDALLALANLRNSYHSNGIHNKCSKSFLISAKQFDFRQGERVECASWDHITVLLRANISVLSSVLLSNGLPILPGPIIDDFAATAKL